MPLLTLERLRARRLKVWKKKLSIDEEPWACLLESLKTWACNLRTWTFGWAYNVQMATWYNVCGIPITMLSQNLKYRTPKVSLIGLRGLSTGSLHYEIYWCGFTITSFTAQNSLLSGRFAGFWCCENSYFCRFHKSHFHFQMSLIILCRSFHKCISSSPFMHILSTTSA